VTTARAEQLRRSLAETLSADGYLRTRAWKQAFVAMPRHAFLPRFFRQTEDLSGWRTVDASSPDWLALVYTDATWVTQLDNDDHRWTTARANGQVTGEPTSSSTAPGLMALMLEALDVHDGHRVLEVGTGTGYNAALLAHRLGSPNVTTVEFDPAIAQRARDILASLGYSPTVITGDGSTGYPPNSPYDRIIATVSVPSVPAVWISQTRSGGIILTNLHRELGGGALARLTVDSRGTAQGRFLPEYGGFMPVRSNPLTATGPLLNTALKGPAGDRRPATLDADAVFHPDFGMLAALLIPDLTSMGFTPDATGPQFWLLSSSGSWACLFEETGAVEQHGPRRLWDELERVHQRWIAWNKPTRDRFGLTVTGDGTHQLWLDTPDDVVAARC